MNKNVLLLSLLRYSLIITFACLLAFSFTAAASSEDSSPPEAASIETSPKADTSELFKPLIADPRWAHFHFAYHNYINDDELRNVGATSFGETLPLHRGSAPFNGEWEFGIQAAVFAVFDLDAASSDLINADYWVGLPLSYRKDRFSGIVRLFHQSSHMGDEYLLRNRVDRINVSYESIDVKASYDINQSYRVYGGGGYMFHRDPQELEPWSAQFGAEFACPLRYRNYIWPVAAIDLKIKEESDWKTDVSIRAGINIYRRKIGPTEYSMLLLLEYFNGYSPNGQFYERQIKYAGVGTHFFF